MLSMSGGICFARHHSFILVVLKYNDSLPQVGCETTRLFYYMLMC